MGKWVWICDCGADDEDYCDCDNGYSVFGLLEDWKEAFRDGDEAKADEILQEALSREPHENDTAHEAFMDIAYHMRAGNVDRLENIANDTPYPKISLLAHKKFAAWAALSPDNRTAQYEDIQIKEDS